MKDVLTIIMAGGRGERLMPLTSDRSKPAVPFGGVYRLIDITLSNCINSQLYKILIFPQYKSQSLVDHLESGWNIFSLDLGHYLKIVAPQQRISKDWYRGTADSVRQNLYLVKRENPKHIIILSGDHVYKMNYATFRRYHEEKGADVTVSLIEVDRDIASSFGIGEVDSDFLIRNFEEKPPKPKTIPDDPSRCLASMGIYIFKTEVLLEALEKTDKEDFGKDIIPELVRTHKVYAYPYKRLNAIEDYVLVTEENGEKELVFEKRTRDSSYWRDVGTLDAYWNANMDLTGVEPFFNLYGKLWPIRTNQPQSPPAKFVFASEKSRNKRVGKALDSLVSSGCIVSGGEVRNSVLSPNVVIRSWARVEETVVMNDVEIGRHCKIKKAIIDKQNTVPPGTKIGYNPKEDKKTFPVTSRGIVVVPKQHYPTRIKYFT